jgi:hypothetical protein
MNFNIIKLSGRWDPVAQAREEQVVKFNVPEAEARELLKKLNGPGKKQHIWCPCGENTDLARRIAESDSCHSGGPY